jgi:hypothetical protein
VISLAYSEPHGVWTPFPDDAPFHIAGLFFRKRNAVNFIRNAARCEGEGIAWGMECVRDPENEHDPHAIEVRGWWDVNGVRGPRRNTERLGYWPKERAAAVAEEHPNAELAVRAPKLVLNDDGEVEIEIIGLVGDANAEPGPRLRLVE